MNPRSVKFWWHLTSRATFVFFSARKLPITRKLLVRFSCRFTRQCILVSYVSYVFDIDLRPLTFWARQRAGLSSIGYSLIDYCTAARDRRHHASFALSIQLLSPPARLEGGMAAVAWSVPGILIKADLPCTLRGTPAARPARPANLVVRAQHSPAEICADRQGHWISRLSKINDCAPLRTLCVGRRYWRYLNFKCHR